VSVVVGGFNVRRWMWF